MRTLGVHKPPPKENILITLEVYTLIISISPPALLTLFIFGGAFSGVRSASSTQAMAHSKDGSKDANTYASYITGSHSGRIVRGEELLHTNYNKEGADHRLCSGDENTRRSPATLRTFAKDHNADSSLPMVTGWESRSYYIFSSTSAELKPAWSRYRQYSRIQPETCQQKRSFVHPKQSRHRLSTQSAYILGVWNNGFEHVVTLKRATLGLIHGRRTCRRQLLKRKHQFKCEFSQGDTLVLGLL